LDIAGREVLAIMLAVGRKESLERLATELSLNLGDGRGQAAAA
jgi:hypothetical protein